MNHFTLVPYGHQEVRAKNPASVTSLISSDSFPPANKKWKKGGKLLSCSSPPHKHCYFYWPLNLNSSSAPHLPPNGLFSRSFRLKFSSIFLPSLLSLSLRAHSQRPNNPSLFMYVSPLWPILLANRSSWVFCSGINHAFGITGISTKTTLNGI